VGTGIAQALPIVVQRYYDAVVGKSANVEIIEQPELHLHPAAHGDLADLYVDAVQRFDIRFIIETHSENFILRLRRRVAAGDISPDQIIIYSISADGKAASEIKPIHIDAKGDVDDWPSGVFSEDFEEVKMLRKTQMEQKK
jgi:predicted ATPase